MERTRVKFKNEIGQMSIGYAILTDGDWIWCFYEKQDKYGYVIHKSNIVKIDE